MAEGKWAPTPWSADIGECFRIRDSNGGQLAMITFLGNGGRFGPRREDPEPWHTLHLMTAAPELYEAVRLAEEVLSDISDEDDPETANTRRICVAALKKVHGESGDDQ